ncbi:MAG: isoprenyl transferase [Victivallales bacterium]|nr:isoprenyl transferase [Victivallales bacterium]MCF7889481.1 isoprenyl transferase [Victivallales bacterium]
MDNLADIKGAVKHLAIIMDGNGRWAKLKGLKRTEGHKEGAKTVRKIIDLSGKYGIKYLTLYAFSTENWRRPSSEITVLMSLLKEFLELNRRTLIEKDVKLKVIGKKEDIPAVTRTVLQSVINETKNNKSGQLILALCYGGREEITHAVREVAEDVKNGKIKTKNIDEKLFSSYLYTSEIPDPDLMIRTSGEFRISNFLLWQLSYSEFWITDTLWPDFDESDLVEALKSFKNRKRRYGGV